MLYINYYTSLNPPPLGGLKRGLGGDIVGQSRRKFCASWGQESVLWVSLGRTFGASWDHHVGLGLS